MMFYILLRLSKLLRCAKSMKIKILLLLALIIPDISFAGKVSDYRIFYGICVPEDGKTKLVMLRKFSMDGSDYILTVDPGNLNTSIIPYREDRCLQSPLFMVRAAFPEKAYCRALNFSERNSGQDIQCRILPGSLQPGRVYPSRLIYAPRECLWIKSSFSA